METCVHCGCPITGIGYSLNVGDFCEACWQIGLHNQRTSLFMQQVAEDIINKTRLNVMPPVLTMNPRPEHEEVAEFNIENFKHLKVEAIGQAGPGTVKIEEFSPGYAIKFSWWDKLVNWFFNKFIYRLK